MSNIPEDLIADVLSRLPVKSLLRFRCVSKQWCALIDSPNFINLQLNQSLKTNTNLSVIFEFRDLLSLAFDPLEDILKDDGDDNILPTFKLLGKIVKLDCHPLESKDFRILGCCNGLICLLSYSTETPILLNPSTKKYQILPPVPPPSFKCRLNPVYEFELLDIVYGFGYDPVNDDYKILRVACSDDEEVPFHYEIIVYSLRSNIWRKIQPNSPRHLKYSRGGLFFNGALHWVATRQSESPVNDDYIVAFDLVVDNYRELQFPNISDYRSVSLGVLGGCLWLGCVYKDYPVELWVMKDYMVQESWTKLSIDLFSQGYKVPEIWKVIILAYSKSSSEVFLTEINGKLCWLHLKEQKVVDLGIRSFGAEICIASLVKLPCNQGTNVL